MASQELVSLLRLGAAGWNEWRERRKNYHEPLDLDGAELATASLGGANLFKVGLQKADLRDAHLVNADLRSANAREANFCGAQLSRADLRKTDLTRANFQKADLRGVYASEATLIGALLSGVDLGKADLWGAKLRAAHLEGTLLRESDLRHADLSEANLTGANLRGVDFSDADLTDATLDGADLTDARLVRTCLQGASLNGCRVYGVSTWSLELSRTKQEELIITPDEESSVTVDNIEVAQFVYLLLNNERIRGVVDTITSKVVLILGRFTPARKAVLDAIREELRRHNYTPIVFDFDKPASRNITETVSTLAHLARFVIADITDAKSIPQELQRIVPDLPSLPVQPVILDSQYEYALFRDFLDYPWVLLPHRYASTEDLIASLATKVVGPALAKSVEIQERRRLIESKLSRP